MLNRWGSALRYLRLAEPVWHWRLSGGICPNCGSHAFISLGRSAFLTRCLGCRTNAVTLATVSVLREIDLSHMRAHEFSSYGAAFEFMRRSCPQFTYSEFFPGQPAVVDGIRNEDITRLTFATDTFDVLTSNGVMEHVPADIQGYRECHRVLKPGGMLIFTVPLYDTPESVQLASLNESGDIVWHAQPEYHDSRRGGPLSAPTFWRHSLNDMCDRVQQVGFRSVELIDVTLCRSQGEPTKVIKAVK
jgi:SAM-dependent methyltransferase